MDTVIDRPWTTDRFLAWEDRQEGKHEFDGFKVISMTGGSVAHQRIVCNLCVLLSQLLPGMGFLALHEMRVRVGRWVRYPDVVICASSVPQTQRTLADAVAVFEVLSDDTAATDRIEKLRDYADIPSLRYYVMLEQASKAAIVHVPARDGAWTSMVVAEGDIRLGGLNIALPLDGNYQGLSFPPDAEVN